MTDQTLGSAIIALRKQKGMTQQELADYMGVSDKAVSKWERDQSLPDVYALARLADLFDVTVDQLLGTEPKPTPDEARRERRSSILTICRLTVLAAAITLLLSTAFGFFHIQTLSTMMGFALFAISIYMFYESRP